jgi:hypothetical protein
MQTPYEMQCSQIANYATKFKQDSGGYSQIIPETYQGISHFKYDISSPNTKTWSKRTDFNTCLFW